MLLRSPSIAFGPADLTESERAALLRLRFSPAFPVRGSWRIPGHARPEPDHVLARLVGMRLAAIASHEPRRGEPPKKALTLTPLGEDFARRLARLNAPPPCGEGPGEGQRHALRMEGAR